MTVVQFQFSLAQLMEASGNPCILLNSLSCYGYAYPPPTPLPKKETNKENIVWNLISENAGFPYKRRPLTSSSPQACVVREQVASWKRVGIFCTKLTKNIAGIMVSVCRAVAARQSGFTSASAG